MQKKKVILVTGATGGIGSAIIKTFAEIDYRVIINYNNNNNKAVELMNELNSSGKLIALAIKANVADRKQVIEMFDTAYEHFGGVDTLINCAGINIDKPFIEFTQSDWYSVQSIILTGNFNCSQEFAKRYNGNNGNIMNIGALTAIRGRKNGANYCSARAGVINLTKCMALELAPNIRVNCVTPGWINTDEVIDRYNLQDNKIYQNTIKTIPLNRLGTSLDIARMVKFLICDSSYITGQNYLVDGGMLMY